MSAIDLESKHVSQPPEYTGNMRDYAQRLGRYVERYLREHCNDINRLNGTALDSVAWSEVDDDGNRPEDNADVTDYAAAQTAAEAYVDTNFVTNVLHQADIADLQSQIDGNITTWFYDGVPTLANSPASSWTTDTLKDNHLGDLYYDQLTGYAYRFVYSSSVYSWVQLADADIALALAAAAAAQDTADGKRRVFVVTPTAPYDVGDLWDAGAAGLKRCSTAKAAGGSYDAADWGDLADITDYTATQAQATAAQAAAQAYAEAQDDLEAIRADAYADGVVSAEEARAIADATAKADAAKAYAEAQDALEATRADAYADGIVSAEEARAIADATTKANAAKAYADALIALEEVRADAYADGQVTAEEARAIADAQSKADAAQAAAIAAASSDATTKADAAQAAAALDATSKSAAAQAAAQAYAEAQDALEQIRADAYADGVVSAEEARAIADAQAKADAAQAAAEAAAAIDAQTKANAAQAAAIAAAALDATTKAAAAQAAAQAYTEAQDALEAVRADAYADGIVSAEESRAIADATARANAAQAAAESTAQAYTEAWSSFGADVTSQNTAAAITGQGDLATVDTVLANQVVAVYLSALTAALGDVYAGKLTGTEIVSPIIRTALEGIRLQMDADGLKFISDDLTHGKWGSFKWGDGTKWGSGVLAYFGNAALGIPIYIMNASTRADIKLPVRANAPSGTAAFGEYCNIQNVLHEVTTAGTPAVWQPVNR